MTTKQSEIQPFAEHVEMISDPSAEPVVYSEVVAQLGLGGRKVQAAEIRGHTLTVTRAKPFLSSFVGTDDPWFCVAIDHDLNDEQITVVLGGQAVTEILKAYAKSGETRPLKFKLSWVEQGRYDGYYVME